MTPKQLNDEEWKLGLYQGRYTKEEMERDAGKDFYSLYKEFAIGAVPRLAKIPGFLLRRPLKKILAKCDEPTLKSLSASMKAQDNRPVVGQITVPAVAVQSRRDELVSPRACVLLKDAPCAALHILPNSRHFYYPPEDLDTLKALFADFLAQH